MFHADPYVLLPCGFPAPQMALGLVFIENVLDLPIQASVLRAKLPCEILMYCAFADAEMHRCGANRRTGLDDVFCELFTAFFSVMLHDDPSASLFHYMIRT